MRVELVRPRTHLKAKLEIDEKDGDLRADDDEHAVNDQQEHGQKVQLQSADKGGSTVSMAHILIRAYAKTANARLKTARDAVRLQREQYFCNIPCGTIES